MSGRITRGVRSLIGFTLVELLVVIGIIALLIGILLPTLSRVRDSGNAVKCASNLKQLFVAFQLYSNTFNGYCMPAQAIGGSSSQYWWLGSETLGRALGMQLGANQNPNTIAERLRLMLDCPANDRERSTLTDNFAFDYTYNMNLGDFRGQVGTSYINANGTLTNNTSYASYQQAHKFKRWTEVPGNVLVLVESSSPRQIDDERFDTLGELTWKKGYGGSPHKNNTRGNVLFHSGAVEFVRIYNWKPELYPARQGNSSRPNIPTRLYTDLEDWMIMAPGKLQPGAVNGGGATRDTVWQKGRVPNF
jgi:hypothetical protein